MDMLRKIITSEKRATKYNTKSNRARNINYFSFSSHKIVLRILIDEDLLLDLFMDRSSDEPPSQTSNQFTLSVTRFLKNIRMEVGWYFLLKM